MQTRHCGTAGTLCRVRAPTLCRGPIPSFAACVLYAVLMPQGSTSGSVLTTSTLFCGGMNLPRNKHRLKGQPAQARSGWRCDVHAAHTTMLSDRGCAEVDIRGQACMCGHNQVNASTLLVLYRRKSCTCDVREDLCFLGCAQSRQTSSNRPFVFTKCIPGVHAGLPNANDIGTDSVLADSTSCCCFNQ